MTEELHAENRASIGIYFTECSAVEALLKIVRHWTTTASDWANGVVAEPRGDSPEMVRLGLLSRHVANASEPSWQWPH
jgi:hypothetical protein